MLPLQYTQSSLPPNEALRGPNSSISAPLSLLEGNADDSGYHRHTTTQHGQEHREGPSFLEGTPVFKLTSTSAVEAERRGGYSSVVLTGPASSCYEVNQRSWGGIKWSMLRLLHREILVHKPSVSFQPRVFKPQSGLTKRRESGRMSSMDLRRSLISCSPGTRGEWMSYTPGPIWLE